MPCGVLSRGPIRRTWSALSVAVLHALSMNEVAVRSVAGRATADRSPCEPRVKGSGVKRREAGYKVKCDSL